MPIVILNIEIADRSLAALQADLLGAHALGLTWSSAERERHGWPATIPIPAHHGMSTLCGSSVRWSGSTTVWTGVVRQRRTGRGFVIGASVQTSAADQRAELDRVMDTVRAGAHFLLDRR